PGRISQHARTAFHSFSQMGIRESLRESFKSKLVQNATWMLSGQGLQLVGRIAYFIIVAHVLGPREYGSFVACTALIGVFSPFASCGTGHVMIKYVARDRNSLPAYLGNALLVTAASAAALTLFALVLRSHVLPSSVGTAMLLAVALADLLGMESTAVCQQAFLALEQGRRFSHLMGFSTGIRFAAALVLMFWGGTATHWAYLYSASAMITMVTAIVVVSRCCARPTFRSNLLVPSVREGVH